ncbi:PREDICTED: bidirectional sugar transporter SWEET17-like isoform X1 [Nelumbo nucifera]|uniref:Bidirectional sugar transporter SWEET n=1 Tax=Nelumbo nucifera TaxID=4432 RepID=A0A1U8A3W5_NELNU|nr:PREDICTED: bidirectional sugar transporter SWEET17-like isoform X1 [Nelumbo nucifera]
MAETESVGFIIGVIGNIISVLVFLSPIGTFWRIVKNRSTEDFESLPYICTLLNSALWTYYGIVKPGAILVATVNGFGVVAETIYILIFLIFAPAKIRANTAILLGIMDVGSLAAAIGVTRFAMHGDLRIDVIGIMCAGLNIVMYASPLAVMKTVVTTKSVEYMPFFLSFFLFLNGGTWAVYAALMGDYFVGIPNGTGFILGAAQLMLYAIYRNAKPSKSKLERLEEGRQHEPLISPCDRVADEVNHQW